MKIGYACLTVGIPETNFRTCTMKNASTENLLEIISHNLKSLENIIDYNILNEIKLFRISSDIIPFGSSTVNTIKWWNAFAGELEHIGEKIKSNNIRVSMHPGQYTVLNSTSEEVVERAIADLTYHNKFLKSLKVDNKSKIILHIGGVYGNKEDAIKRFEKNFKTLDKEIKNRLVIENDDKSYNINEVLNIGQGLNIPVVYDNLHNEVLTFDNLKDDIYWVNKCRKTWEKDDGVQKIHYSQQNPNKRSGSHSKTISLEEFGKFISKIDYREIDIMMEVKDKNLSAMKAINYFDNNKKITRLEVEWSKYKYNILEHSPKHYNEIRSLLKDKKTYPVLKFYKLIDEALEIEATIGNSINSTQHIWGYFKSYATKIEGNKFEKYLERYKKGTLSINALKNLLWEMTIKYNEEYLLKSYYFHF
ncbi:MAG TPA: UV DNA damage repair endonuclease UvsE [Tissierellaceae bacterium]|nr:UV DNA damage repair endonuclease UvsE [Tissierellaceae bacterium]